MPKRISESRPRRATVRPSVGLATPARRVPRALAEVAGFLINQLAAALRAETEAALAGPGLHPRQVGIVLVLQEGAVSQHVLGLQLAMDRTTTMQLVTALEQAGIVAREDDPDDRRAYRVTLTADGRRLAEHVARQVAEVERRVLAGLTVSEQRMLKALARKALEV